MRRQDLSLQDLWSVLLQPQGGAWAWIVCLFLHFHLSALEQAMKSAALGLLCLLKAKDSLPFVI